jgi:hypothetical protein
MMAAAPSSPVASMETVSLKDFFDHLRYSSPFDQDRISDPAEAKVDVPGIHHQQFEELAEYAQSALRQGRGVGVVLWGEAGVGKSHLLARFSRWAGQDDRALYVFLHNLHVHPDRLPRYVLKSVISRLTSGRSRDFRNSRLYGLLYEIVKAAIQKYSERSREHKAVEAWQCFERYLDEHTGGRLSAVDDRTIYRVLFQFFFSVYRAGHGHGDETTAALAVRWLAGDVLDPEEAELLRVRPEDGQTETSLPDNQAIERVMVAMMELCRLRSRPFILVFDQVENLDPDELQSLARFCHVLIDRAPNLLLVTSGVQKQLLEAKEADHIGGASWDRIAQNELMLYPISPTEARQLLEARLEPFFESYAILPRVKKLLTTDTIFPLGTNWLKEQIGDAVEVKPRLVIGWAQRRWKEQAATLKKLGGDAWLREWEKSAVGVIEERRPEAIIDEKVEEKIREQVSRRELDPSALPPDASNLCGLVEALLKQCRDGGAVYSIAGLERPPGRKTQKPAYDLLVHERSPDGRDVTTGVAFLVTGSKTSVAASLRRLVKEPQPAEHVIVVCDQRQPLDCGVAGQEYLNELEKRGPDGFRVMKLSFPQYAQLDALEAVIGEARSGDLEATFGNEGSRQLAEAEVIASHHRQDRYRQHPLLRELLCEAPLAATQPTLKELAEDHVRQFIAAQLALTMGLSSVELAQKYHERHAKAEFAFAEVKTRLETVAQQMHHEELLNATPTGDYLFLLNRPGR